jgi:parvulin-like peptidyl-prolyl isomerase
MIMGEELFISINGDKVDLKTAFNILRGLDDSFLNCIREMIILRQYGLANDLAVTDSELQKAVDEYRYLMGLESAEAFKQHLNDRKISLLSFQSAMENVLLRGKAIDAVSDEEVDAYIAENKLSMEKAELYNICLEDKNTAQEIKTLLDDGEENFLALAYEHSKDESTAVMGGYMGKLGRKSMAAEVEAAVFSASVGDVIGPIKTEQGYNLFKVIAFVRPDKSDNKLRTSIKQAIISKKLAGLNASADVESSLDES